MSLNRASLKIAIVAPSAVPFCVGGAEKLWWGLQTAINQTTPHQAELIKLPSPERDLREILASYQRFSQLNLAHFDRVIVTKYPSWMVSHPHRICYLQHPLRGLYDTYHYTNLPETYVSDYGPIQRLQALMQRYRAARVRPVLDGLFAQLADLARDPHCPADAWQFPSPWARELVQFLDATALAPAQIDRYAAISRTVAARSGYFPPHVPVDIIHHPSDLSHFYTGDFDYLFTASRFVHTKRLRLLIEAMQSVQSPVRLKIVGTGPEAATLQMLAAPNPRIEFLGFVNDSQLIDLYANALAVPYLPLDEDYGLVTIEAMKSGKPVITTTDAGGPNEFVVDGETGYVVAPHPQAIAQKIDWLYTHPQVARRLGQNAQKAVAGITWENTIRQLLEPEPTPIHQRLTQLGKRSGQRLTHPKSQPSPQARRALQSGSSPQSEQELSIQAPSDGPAEPGARSGTQPAPPPTAPDLQTAPRRPKLVVALTFPVFPPRSGGQSRVYHLYRHLASRFDIELVTWTAADQPGFQGEIAPQLYETRIPKSAEHQRQETAIEQALGVPVTDVAMPQLYSLTPAYEAALAQAAIGADVLVACHPYLYPALRALGDYPIWYEAQDVEWDLKQQMFADRPQARQLLETVRQVEQDCCNGSDRILTCAQADADRLIQLYNLPPDRLLTVPNGVDTGAIAYLDLNSRRAQQQRLGLKPGLTAVFLAAWHGPNLEGVERIVAMAPQLPAINFLIVGSAGLTFQQAKMPANVHLMGVVDEPTKAVVLDLADVALNPIGYGSGTNLKMLEYFAAGLPVVTTPVGGRGLDADEYCWITPIEDFPRVLQQLQSTPLEALQRVASARLWVEARFDWAGIATRFLAALDGIDAELAREDP